MPVGAHNHRSSLLLTHNRLRRKLPAPASTPPTHAPYTLPCSRAAPRPQTVSEASQAERVPSGDQAAAAAAAALDANNPPKVVDPLSLTLRCVLTETGRVLAGDVADLEIVLPLEELADAVGACATKRGGGDSEEVRALRAAVTEARDGQASMVRAFVAVPFPRVGCCCCGSCCLRECTTPLTEPWKNRLAG